MPGIWTPFRKLKTSKRVKQLEGLSRKVSTEVDSNRQTDRLQNEMKVYEALQCPKNFLSKMDTLRFWKCRRDSMPLPSKLACTLFSVPASAADVERTWSAAGLTVNKRRSKISSDNLKAIMCINRRSFVKFFK